MTTLTALAPSEILLSETICPIGGPALVFDHATGEAPALIDHAASSRFEDAASLGSGYPGHFGALPMAYVTGMIEALVPLVERHFATGPIRPGRVRGNFSLLTYNSNDMNDMQKLPHVDSADPMQFAVVHYLCDARHGGTGFFRHRATGFETLTPERVSNYNAALDQELSQSPPSTGHVGYDDPFFALTAACEARMDRLVLYRSARLHGALADTPPGGDALNPRRGRLTANLFIQCVQRG